MFSNSRPVQQKSIPFSLFTIFILLYIPVSLLIWNLNCRPVYKLNMCMILLLLWYFNLVAFPQLFYDVYLQLFLQCSTCIILVLYLCYTCVILVLYLNFNEHSM